MLDLQQGDVSFELAADGRRPKRIPTVIDNAAVAALAFLLLLVLYGTAVLALVIAVILACMWHASQISEKSD